MIDRLADTLIRLLASTPARGLATGIIALWLLWHLCGAWTLAIAAIGTAWELIAYPGRVRLW